MVNFAILNVIESLSTTYNIKLNVCYKSYRLSDLYMVNFQRAL